MNRVYTMDDLRYSGRAAYYGPVDEHDNPVRRTKQSHPYSYDGFVQWRGGENDEATATAYSDRMVEWNREKYEQAGRETIGGPHPRWDIADPKKIEAFLRIYFDKPTLRLVLVMEYCNQATGYPVWRFDYAEVAA